MESPVGSKRSSSCRITSSCVCGSDRLNWSWAANSTNVGTGGPTGSPPTFGSSSMPPGATPHTSEAATVLYTPYTTPTRVSLSAHCEKCTADVNAWRAPVMGSERLHLCCSSGCRGVLDPVDVAQATDDTALRSRRRGMRRRCSAVAPVPRDADCREPGACGRRRRCAVRAAVQFMWSARSGSRGDRGARWPFRRGVCWGRRRGSRRGWRQSRRGRQRHR